MKVKNLKWGPSGPRPLPNGHKSWLDYWSTNYGRTVRVCKNKDCDNESSVGGHVMTPDGKRSNNWYIIPLCDSCNSEKNRQEFEVEQRHLIVISNQLS
jgi:hypothetical protein